MSIQVSALVVASAELETNEYDGDDSEHKNSVALSACVLGLLSCKACLRHIRLLLLEVEKMLELDRLIVRTGR